MNQAAILLDYLRVHGRTSCADLERNCDVRSVTTRMSEMIRAGHPIERSRGYLPNSRGKARPVTYYELAGKPAQHNMFTDE